MAQHAYMKQLASMHEARELKECCESKRQNIQLKALNSKSRIQPGVCPVSFDLYNSRHHLCYGLVVCFLVLALVAAKRRC
jgi:hypothetical protein